MSGGLAADDGRWARPILASFGPLRAELGREYLARWHKRPRDANVFLRTCAEFWQAAPPLAKQVRLGDLEEMDRWARKLAVWCAEQGVEHTCEAWGIDWRSIRGSADARQLRGEDHQFWRRQLRRIVSQWWDQFMRLAGFVHRHRQVYCSDQCHRWVTRRQEANRRTLADLIAVSDQGDQLGLDELAEASAANPRNRFIEAMVRVRGIEEWAESQGWAAVMATITCPSRMHSRHVKSGALNRRYDGTTPRQANDYLLGLWARVRAKLDREGIPWAGFRSAEPHHDGCPHWHVLVFAPRPDMERVEGIIRAHALADSGTEPGARKRRVRFERIDKAKGSAASYLAKYIAKGLNGGSNESDLMGNPAEFAAERITAWARTWRIRQFAFYGQPSVTLYREYRRLRERPAFPHSAPWEACDRYRWAEFIEHQRQDTRFVARLLRHTKPMRDKYGDPLPDACKPIIGVQIQSIPLPTRLKTWSIERRRGAALRDGAAVAPWTRVTNCTERAPPDG